MATSNPPTRYEALAHYVRDCIEQGTFQAGERLPSVRQMAELRQVSVTTVLEGYRRLEDWGLIVARPQSGYYVQSPPSAERDVPRIMEPHPRTVVMGRSALIRDLLQEAQTGAQVPLGAAVLHPDLLPQRMLARMQARVLREDPAVALSYSFPPGHEGLRHQIARRLAMAGCVATADDIIITSGCTEAISISLGAVVRPGDTVAIESPAYYAMLEWLEVNEVHAHPVQTHPDTGMDLDALEEVLQSGTVQAVFVVPSYSNPLGACMPPKAKERLARLAAQYETPVVEDDIYGELAFARERPPLVKGYDADGWVMNCGSFSKVLSSGLRIGWAVPGRWYQEVLRRKRISTMASDTAAQWTLAEYLEHGGYDRHLRRLRRTLHDNTQRFIRHVFDAFPEGTRVTRPSGGFLLWVELPHGHDATELKAVASRHGISIGPGALFGLDDRYDHCLRLNTGVPWSERMAAAVHTLGALAKEGAGKG